MMKPTKIYTILVTLSMLTVGLAATVPTAGAQEAPEIPEVHGLESGDLLAATLPASGTQEAPQLHTTAETHDAPEVQGNCYDADGDPVAVSANGQNVHGDHNGGNAVDVVLLQDQETSGDDNDLVDVNGGIPYSVYVPGATDSSDTHGGDDCDTVDVDLATRFDVHNGDDSDTVDADVLSVGRYSQGSSGDDADTVDAGVGGGTKYWGNSDNDTADVNVGFTRADDGQSHDDDTFSCDVRGGGGPLPFPAHIIGAQGTCAGQDFEVP